MNHTKKRFFNLLFFLSGMILSNILLNFDIGLRWELLLNIVVTAGIYCFLIYKVKITEPIFENSNKVQLVVSAVLAFQFIMLYIAKNSYVGKMGTYLNLPPAIFQLIIGILAYAASVIYFYWIIGYIIKLFHKIKLTNAEVKFISVFMIIFSVLLILIYCSTSAFYIPTDAEGVGVHFDAIYTSDSGFLASADAFAYINNGENDIRQPFFAIFSLPFSMVARILSNVLFFVPYAYALVIQLIQLFLLGIAVTLLGRLVHKESNLLFKILYCCSYPFLIFFPLIEQYIFATFWLVLFFYLGWASEEKLDDKTADISFIAAAGSLSTSIVLFPLLYEGKSISQMVKRTVRIALICIGCVFLFGRLDFFLNILMSFNKVMKYAGGEVVAYSSRVLQYINFAALCMFRPSAMIEYEIPSYQLAQVNSINLLGVGVLILCLAGFWMNRKNKYAKLCMFWVVFSFLLLGLFGWGTVENGLVLYSLYFSWAFVSLVYLVTDKMIKNTKLKTVVLLILIASMIIVNGAGLYDIVKFGMQYYPVPTI